MPTYTVASWTNPIHTPGTFHAWAKLPKDVPKWLRIHNKQEWADYYDENSQRDLLRFFDRYLKGKMNNGWEATPKVRLSVLNMGLRGISDIVLRPESEFHLSTLYKRYFLRSDGTMSLDVPSPMSSEDVAEESIVQYDSERDDKAVFKFQLPEPCETTGYFMAHLVMSSAASHPEMDVFVQVEHLTEWKQCQGTQKIRPKKLLTITVLKLAHDW